MGVELPEAGFHDALRQPLVDRYNPTAKPFAWTQGKPLHA
jgi:hypothetical protein